MYKTILTSLRRTLKVLTQGIKMKTRSCLINLPVRPSQPYFYIMSEMYYAVPITFSYAAMNAGEATAARLQC